MARHFLKLRQQLGARRSQDIVDFMNLVKFVISWEERKQSQYFEVYAAHAPVVHFVIVVSVCQQTLRRPVPPRADVLGEGRLAVDAATRAEVGKLYLVVFDKNIFGLDVSMEYPVFMHVVNRFQNLVHVILDALLGQVLPAPFDCLVHVHVHQLKDQRQTASWLVEKHLVQRDDVGMGGQALQRLDFT